MPEQPPYTRYAAVYTRSGQSTFSLAAWSHVRRRLRALGWTGRRVLDLAAGTGAAAARMRDEGLFAVALDLSREMLLAGRAEEAEPLPRCAADIRALPLADGAVDLVTCFYDSLNYLLSADDLEAACREAGRVLARGGWLVFDLNTEEHLRQLWTGVCHAELHDDLAAIWIGKWLPDRRVSRLSASFFQRGDDGRWDRFDEVHDERGFSPAEIDAALKAGELKLQRVEDARGYGKPTASSRRLIYYARRG